MPPVIRNPYGIVRRHPPLRPSERNPDGSSTSTDASYSISEAEYKRRENIEVAAIAHILNLPRRVVRQNPELMEATLPGITGIGDAISSIITLRDWENIRDPQGPDRLRARDVQENGDLFLRALPHDALLRDAMGDAGAANDVVYTAQQFAEVLADAGVNFARMEQVRARIFAMFTPLQAQRTFREWIVQKVLPKLAASGISYAAGELLKLIKGGKNVVGGTREVGGGKQEMNENLTDPSNVSGVDFRARNDIQHLEPDDELFGDPDIKEKFQNTIADKEIADAAVRSGTVPIKDQTVQHSDHVVRPPRGVGRIPIQFMPLDDSVGEITSPDLPLGPADNLIPKSSPIYPPTLPLRPTPAGHDIFTDGMRGDSLSEYSNNPHAYTRRTTITPPPSQNVIPTSQYYSPNVHSSVAFQKPTPPPPQQNFKRKAELEPIHGQRHMESQISQNYDPAFVPSMPSSMSANTSVHWQQYSGQNHGFTAPLDDAPNVVGIGYDTQSVEREFAQDAFKPPEDGIKPDGAPEEEKKHNPDHAMKPPRAAGRIPVDMTKDTPDAGTPTSSERAVNPANATNPTFRNAGRATPQTAPPRTRPQ
jgi:hypothetical protein